MLFADLVLEPAGIAAWLFVGLAAGWLAGKLTEEASYGTIGDLLLGAAGALLAGGLFGLFVKGTPSFWVALLAALGGAILLILVARAIAAGQGITLDGELATRYPPGFSILLAGVFRAGDALGLGDEAMLLAFRLLCAGLSVVLVYGLARLIWSPWLSLLPALAWMTYPFFLWLTKQPNSEVPFIPVLYAALYVFWRTVLRGTRGPRAWAFYLLAGMLVGAAMLIHLASMWAVFVAFSVVFASDDPHRAKKVAPVGAVVGEGG